MLAALLPLVLARQATAPLALALGPAAVGTREYRLVLRAEFASSPAETESVTIRETTEAKGAGFGRVRTVLKGSPAEDLPQFRVGTREEGEIDARGAQIGKGPWLIPLPDVVLPVKPISVGGEWESELPPRILDVIPFRCRLVGKETIAGREALRLRLFWPKSPKGIVLEEAFTLLDARDLLPLQTLIRARVTRLDAGTRVRFRLCREGVPGLTLPE